MKILSLVLLGGALCLSTVRADVAIIQQIQQEGGSKPLNMTMTTKVKGDKARLDMSSEFSSIVDLNTMDAVSLFHPGKKMIKISGTTVKAMQSASGGTADATPLKATGKKETISGFACEEYETTSQGAKVQIWLTKDVPEAQKVMSKLGSLATDKDPFGAILKRQELQGYPIKIEVALPDGSKLVSLVTSLKTDALPEADFTAPTDYEAVTPR